MKVRVEYEMPDDQRELLVMMHGNRMEAALRDIDTKLRAYQKYDANIDDVVRECRRLVWETLEGLE